MGPEGLTDLLVFFFVTDYDIVCIELNRLIDKKFAAVVGCEQLNLEKVGVLSYHVQCLCAYRSC